MKLLGIMVCHMMGLSSFKEFSIYRSMCETARRQGFKAFVFTPLSIDWSRHEVGGIVYDAQSKGWERQALPLPNLIYDRCFYRNRRQFIACAQAISKLRKHHNVQLLGQPLQGKWTIHNILIKNTDLSPHVPLTKQYQGMRSIFNWLQLKNEALLKPQSGSQGRGVLQIKRHHSAYIVTGRSMQNRTVNMLFNERSAFKQWLAHFIKQRKYLIQAYLSLTTSTGEAFDVRSLMQKNHHGEWQLTGMAVRRGAAGSITSNLHGGGTAEPLIPFLSTIYGTKKAEDIQAEISKLSYTISTHLEHYYGRLLELGIDFGIDRQGLIWILEVNSKPGRAIFLHLHHLKQRKSSIQNPIHYARYLLDRKLGG